MQGLQASNWQNLNHDFVIASCLLLTLPFYSGSGLLKLQCALESPGDLVKAIDSWAILRDSDSTGPGMLGFVILKSSQVRLMLLDWGPHSEKQGLEQTYICQVLTIIAQEAEK